VDSPRFAVLRLTLGHQRASGSPEGSVLDGYRWKGSRVREFFAGLTPSAGPVVRGRRPC
jgi:hypothetical protein